MSHNLDQAETYSTTTDNDSDDNDQQNNDIETSSEESTTSESEDDDHEEESETSTDDKDEEKNMDQTESTTSNESEDQSESEDEDESESEENSGIFPWYIIVDANDNSLTEKIDEDANGFEIRAKNLLTEVVVRLTLQLCKHIQITKYLPNNHSASFTSCCFNYDKNNLTTTDYNKLKRFMKDAKISFSILFLSPQTNIVIDEKIIFNNLPIVKDNLDDNQIINQMTKLLSDQIKDN